MLQEQIKNELKDAMRAKETMKVTVLRSLLSGFTNELVAKKQKPDEAISDEDALAVINRAAKQRKDSIEQFTKGNRLDLADNEKKELEIIQSYLPTMMSVEEIEPIVQAKMEALGVTDLSANNAQAGKSGVAKTANGSSPGAANTAALRGKLIGAVMGELKGEADGADVKAVVEKLLS